MYKVDDQVDMLTFHYNFDGNLMKKETEEAQDQENYWEDKKKRDK